MKFATLFLVMIALSARAQTCPGWDFRMLATDNRPAPIAQYDADRPLGATGTPEFLDAVRDRVATTHQAVTRLSFDPKGEHPFPMALKFPEAEAMWKANPDLRIRPLGMSSDGKFRPSKFEAPTKTLAFNVGYMRNDPNQEFVGTLARANFQRTYDGNKIIAATDPHLFARTPSAHVAVYHLERAVLDAELRYYEWARTNDPLAKRAYLDEMTTGKPEKQIRARKRYLADTFGLDAKLVDRLWDVPVSVTPWVAPKPPEAAQ